MAYAGDIAARYDLFYRDKDYAGEAARVLEIAREHTAGTRLLDIGCGTGLHLERFDGCERSGFDLSPELIAVAKRRLPDATLWVDDMRSFEARGEYDIITCMFSAIGYVTSVEGVRQTYARIAAALAPGGAAIIEPWLKASVWKPNYVIEEYYEDEGVVRFMTSAKDGMLTKLAMHVLVGHDGTIDHSEEHHELRFYDRAEHEDAATSAGLAFEEIEGFGRGLVVLTKN